jgi:hypothetical protein
MLTQRVEQPAKHRHDQDVQPVEHPDDQQDPADLCGLVLQLARADGR